MRGIVKSWNSDQGFIAREFCDDLFVSIDDVWGGKELTEGQEVEFSVGHKSDYRPAAQNVRPVGEDWIARIECDEFTITI